MNVVKFTLLLMLSIFAARAESPMNNTESVIFPSLMAANLEKRELTLPQDFEGDHNLLLIAFEREQQKDVDTWLREMKRFEDIDPTFHYYELPVIQRPSAITRWFIDNGMRRGIPDRKARERTITLYIDKKPFCEVLRLTDQKTIYAVLLDRTGKVLWRAEGSFDEVKGTKLREALEALHK